MNDAIYTARQKMRDGAYTCVVIANDEEYTSRERGVKPLLSLLERHGVLTGAVAADKVVGAGAAHLYVLLGIDALWADVISTSALRVLNDVGIEVSFGERVPHIINRRGDGVCPMETAVVDAKSAEEAYRLILDTLRRIEQGPEN